MNNTIVITGGATGIGAATIDRLLAEGHEVINLDIAASNRAGVTNVHCDLSDARSIDQALGNLPSQFDGLVHVAGVAPGAVPERDVVAINFLGLRHLNRALAGSVREGGAIVIVASSIGRDWQDNTANVEGLLDTPDYEAGIEWLGANQDVWEGNAYKFAKQCAVAYTFRAAGEVKSQGVNVNCVNPGIVETRLSPWFRDLVGAQRYDAINTAVGRPGNPDDIAGVILFLLSDDARWVNGAEFQVDGGYRAGVTGGWIDVDPV